MRLPLFVKKNQNKTKQKNKKDLYKKIYILTD